MATSKILSVLTCFKWPFSSRIIRWQILRAEGLWVMMMQVGLWGSDLTDFKTLTSVSGSRAEVASSKINIGFFLKNERAMAKRWACPSEMPVAFSPITVSMPFSNSLTKSKAQAFFKASYISSSVASKLPYLKLSSIVPENKVFPCGT